jgi:predicted branched-subunit amino acid permease
MGIATRRVVGLTEHRAGAAAIAPAVVGYLPFALLVGATAGDSAEPLAAWFGTWLIFGGSAHLAVLDGLASGAALASVVTVALLVNARLLVYSAALAPAWRDQPRWFRVLGAATLVDITWALARRRAAEPGSAQALRAYQLGAALTLAAGWGVAVTVGAVAGRGVGGVPGIELAAPLCLAALVVPRLRDRRAVRVAVAAGATALVTAAVAPSVAVLAAMGAGVAAGGARSGSEPHRSHAAAGDDEEERAA